MKYMIDKKKYKELINKYGSPLYVYDKDILEDRCNDMMNLKKNLERFLGIKINIHYSVKANNNPSLIKIIKESGLYVDSMSPLELDICKKCGYTNDEILYVCNNVSKDEMRLIHDNNLLICLDSLSQINTWGELFPNSDIMVRINPGIEGVGHSDKVVTSGKETKFGISKENFDKLYEIVNKYNLNIKGVHLHLGSLFLDDKVDEYLEGVSAFLDIVKEYFGTASIIDLGGGFGIPYKNNENKLDLNLFEDKLVKVLESYLKEIPSIKEIKFEPGRYVVCESGILLGTVNSIKNENNTIWIGTDIGMNELVRPSMYGAYHEIDVITDNIEEKNASICGNICESCDVLGRDRKITIPNIDDIVIIYDTGAYGYSMSSSYTGRGRASEILINKDENKLIRKREEIEDIERNIVW